MVRGIVIDGKMTAKTITSLTNPVVKSVRALDRRKARRETGLFVAEGTSLLIAARDAGQWPEKLLFHATIELPEKTQLYLDQAKNSDTHLIGVNQAILSKLTGKDNPQSLVGVFQQKWSPAPAIGDLQSVDVWLALENIRDPGNLGTIIRTVDAVGGRGVLLVGQCCDPFQKECVRATMGSIFSVPLVRLDPQAFHDLAVEWPGDVAGLHLAGQEDYRSAQLKRPLMIVMGSEGPGLSDAADAVCSRRVRIPMVGKLDSLNLSVATALMLYEARRDALKLT